MTGNFTTNTSNEIRELTDLEKSILDKIIFFIEKKQDILKDQVFKSKVREIDEYGSLEFFLSDARNYENITGPVATARMKDNDTVEGFGPYVNFVLFLKNGYINELQIYKDDGGKINSEIRPENFLDY